MANCPQCEAPTNLDFGMGNCNSCGALLIADMDGKISLAEGFVASTAASPSQGMSSHDLVADAVIVETHHENPMQDVVTFANSEVSQAKDGQYLYKILISGIDSKELREELRHVLQDKRFMWNSEDVLREIKDGKLTLDYLNPVKASVLIQRMKHLALQISWQQVSIVKTLAVIFCAFTLSLFLSVKAFAEEAHGEESHAEAAGGHGEAGGGPGEAEKKKPSRGELTHTEYMKLNGNVNLLSSKVKSLKIEVKEMTEHVKYIKEPTARDAYWNELIEKKKDLEKSRIELEKAKSKVRYEFPEKGETLSGKKGQHTEGENTSEVGVDAKITRNLEKMQKVYRGLPRPTPAEEEKKKVKPSPTPDRVKLEF